MFSSFLHSHLREKNYQMTAAQLMHVTVPRKAMAPENPLLRTIIPQ